MWKKEKKENLEEAAHAFEEYVATFQDDSSKVGKVWVKAGTFDAGRRVEDTREKGQLYKPQSRLSELADKLSSAERADEYARMMAERKPERPAKKRAQGDKKKSNLEIFKEELKMIQEEREERHKYKDAASSVGGGGGGASFREAPPPSNIDLSKTSSLGSHDMGDPNTTNLYLANLNPTMTEQQLKEMFGKYGPLASIKIMWPRCDEDKARGSHCGFAAFMNRKDGERALKHLNGKEIMSFKMKLGWGKAVPIPACPIYVPPAMLELTTPPLPSGLPFNAQPHKRHLSLLPRSRHQQVPPGLLDRVLPHAVVKVVIPNDRHLLMTIHRLVEFVIRGGPMFEAMIMNREINNPMFKFLFENQSPVHVYYRWKLFSLLQGDTPYSWRSNEFRMFRGGSVWRPPPMELFTRGMPDALFEDEDDEKAVKKGSLSAAQWDRLLHILRHLTPERVKIAEAMVFCIEHSEAADEICDAILESLTGSRTSSQKRIARLYLVSDILHNCGVRVTNASFYRTGLQARLPAVFRGVGQAYAELDSHLKAEGFKVRVMKIFRAWEDWAVYPSRFLVSLQNTFLGLASTTGAGAEDGADDAEDAGNGAVSEEEDLDGVPLDGATLLKGALKLAVRAPLPPAPVSDDDIDGVPMDAVPTPVPDEPRSLRKPALPAGFVPSRWETVDPEEVEAQAMTTSKWDLLAAEDDAEDADGGSDDGSEGSGGPAVPRDGLDEGRRARLREVELKTVKYQDELEAGRQQLKSGWSVAQQVEHYRRKLLRRAEKEAGVAKVAEKPVKTEKPSSKRSEPRDATPPPAKRSRRSRSPAPRRSPRRSRSRGRRTRSPKHRTPPRERRRPPSPPAPSSSSSSSSSSRRRKHK